MLSCNTIQAVGTWSEELAADTVNLDFDGRHRRRRAMKGEAGLEFLLDLPQAAVLREGDGLVLSDGRLVRVKAAPERLMEIAATDDAALVRIAWHLGNRHLATQLLQGRLRIRHDHVIAEMVRGLGGTVTDLVAAFDPEGGAFAHPAAHHEGHDALLTTTHAHGAENHEHPQEQ